MDAASTPRHGRSALPVQSDGAPGAPRSGENGVVLDSTGRIDSRAVVITALDRREVQVPNRDVFNNIVYNTSDVKWRRHELPFAIAYGEDLSKVRNLVTEAVTALDAVYDDPAPVCYVNALGGDGAEFRLRFCHDFETRIAARDEVAQTVIETLLVADIKLGTPEMIVYRGGPIED